MLGNDVIDLDDLDARPETFRPRFDERVFSGEERQAIARDDSPHAFRWAHWGAKEAAYKLARQIDPQFVFSPIQLIARFETAEIATSSSSNISQSCVERRGTLNLPENFRIAKAREVGCAFRESRALEIRSFETTESVHVVALPESANWDELTLSVEKRSSVEDRLMSPADPSRAVRALAVREIGRKLNLGADRLEIGRRGKVPTVELDGGQTSLALSLSHHGRFVAFAMMPAPEIRGGKRFGFEANQQSEMILTDPVMDSVGSKAASE